MDEPLKEKDSLEEQDEQQDEEQDKEEKSDTVPLKKYMEEKKRRQDFERQVRDFKAAQERTEQENKYVQDGVDPQVAKHFAEHDAKLAKIEEMRIAGEIKELSQKDLYSDAKDHIDEIKKAMQTYGVPANQAYMMTQWNDLKAKEFAEKQAQLALYDKDETTEKEVETGPSGIAKQKTYPSWDKEDDKALHELQKAQPDAGWTKESYYKMMYG